MFSNNNRRCCSAGSASPRCTSTSSWSTSTSPRPGGMARPGTLGSGEAGHRRTRHCLRLMMMMMRLMMRMRSMMMAARSDCATVHGRAWGERACSAGFEGSSQGSDSGRGAARLRRRRASAASSGGPTVRASPLDAHSVVACLPAATVPRCGIYYHGGAREPVHGTSMVLWSYGALRSTERGDHSSLWSPASKR